jgi:hypothetical protein
MLRGRERKQERVERADTRYAAPIRRRSLLRVKNQRSATTARSLQPASGEITSLALSWTTLIRTGSWPAATLLSLFCV